LQTLIHKILSWFDTRSEYEKRDAERMLAMIRNSPKSMRVVGRGTVVVDPEEIYNSPQFRADLVRSRQLIEMKNIWCNFKEEK
jgi:hypothetical protein